MVDDKESLKALEKAMKDLPRSHRRHDCEDCNKHCPTTICLTPGSNHCLKVQDCKVMARFYIFDPPPKEMPLRVPLPDWNPAESLDLAGGRPGEIWNSNVQRPTSRNVYLRQMGEPSRDPEVGSFGRLPPGFSRVTPKRPPPETEVVSKKLPQKKTFEKKRTIVKTGKVGGQPPAPAWKPEVHYRLTKHHLYEYLVLRNFVVEYAISLMPSSRMRARIHGLIKNYTHETIRDRLSKLASIKQVQRSYLTIKKWKAIPKRYIYPANKVGRILANVSKNFGFIARNYISNFSDYMKRVEKTILGDRRFLPPDKIQPYWLDLT